MLTNTDYLDLLLKKTETTFFYHDRPVLYIIEHNKEKYLIALAEEDLVKQTETFIVLKYSAATYALMQDENTTPREQYLHPENTVHLVVMEYRHSGPVVISGEQYKDKTTIPDEYLPTADAKWYN